ncbi:MAG: phage tail assembly chaperone [Hyphomicrobiaceae bacterium]|nr:phage tail assembly chaperone [Hyphomicrobiaceae bacterium]
MAAGLGLLRLEPRAFWSMTPKELQAALDGLRGPAALDAPPGKSAVMRMIERYPDERKTR